MDVNKFGKTHARLILSGASVFSVCQFFFVDIEGVEVYYTQPKYYTPRIFLY